MVTGGNGEFAVWARVVEGSAPNVPQSTSMLALPSAR